MDGLCIRGLRFIIIIIIIIIIIVVVIVVILFLLRNVSTGYLHFSKIIVLRV